MVPKKFQNLAAGFPGPGWIYPLMAASWGGAWYYVCARWFDFHRLDSALYGALLGIVAWRRVAEYCWPAPKDPS